MANVKISDLPLIANIPPTAGVFPIVYNNVTYKMDWSQLNNQITASGANPLNITGTGTTNSIPKWTTGGSVIGDSVISDVAGAVTVAGAATFSGALSVTNGRINLNGNASDSKAIMSLGDATYPTATIGAFNTGGTVLIAGQSGTGMTIGTTGAASFSSSVGSTFYNVNNVGGKFAGEGGATSYLGIYKDDNTPIFRVVSNGSGAATFSSTNAKINTGNWHETISDLTSMAAGVGGGLSFTGYKTGTSAQGLYSAIDGYKENGTSGNELGGFRVWTSNGTNLVKQLDISSTGAATFSSGLTAVGNITTSGGTFVLPISAGGNFQMYVSGNNYAIYSSLYGNMLLMDKTTGAATFSESVSFVSSSSIPSVGFANNADGLLIMAGATNGVRINNANNSAEIFKITNAGAATFKESVNFNNKGCIKAANGSIQNGTATVTITPNDFNGVMQIMVGVYGNGEGSSARALWFCGGYISGNMGVSELVRVNGGSIVISALSNPGGNTLTFTVQYLFPNAADISVTCIGNNANTSPIEIAIT